MTSPPASLEVVIRETVRDVRSASREFRDPAHPLQRRREALRRFLPTRYGERPIRTEFDFAAGSGWRRAMRRATGPGPGTRDVGPRIGGGHPRRGARTRWVRKHLLEDDPRAGRRTAVGSRSPERLPKESPAALLAAC